jgi:hypothetical protein
VFLCINTTRTSVVGTVNIVCDSLTMTYPRETVGDYRQRQRTLSDRGPQMILTRTTYATKIFFKLDFLRFFSLMCLKSMQFLKYTHDNHVHFEQVNAF